ncbi:MAG: glycosyltransferase 87 family protein, partial [Verrucomicrobiae bacterium]|nr:glycosyltransferase 87 family protein [Verrucomicrobiae bacterium]
GYSRLAWRRHCAHHARRDETVSTRREQMNWTKRVGYRRVALLLWGVPLLAITVMVVRRPTHRSVTPVYHRCVQHWMSEAPLYANPLEYNYPPCFPLVFAPFRWLPAPLGDVLWRWMAWVLIATGLWKLLRGSEREFLAASALAIPLSLGALRNGQANALLAGLLLHAAAALQRERWMQAAFCAAVAAAVKPFALAFGLLAILLYRKTFWPLVAGLCVAALLPFAFGSHGYVVGEYRAFVANLGACANPAEHRFADVAGLLRSLGVELSPAVSAVARTVAAVAVALLWGVTAPRLTEPSRACWLLLLAVTYLMLFNPMTETNSYVLAAPAMAVWSVHTLREPATRRLGWTLVTIILATSAFAPFRARFKLFWYPTMTACFTAVVAVLLLRHRIWQRPVHPQHQPCAQTAGSNVDSPNSLP